MALCTPSPQLAVCEKSSTRCCATVCDTHFFQQCARTSYQALDRPSSAVRTGTDDASLMPMSLTTHDWSVLTRLTSRAPVATLRTKNRSAAGFSGRRPLAAHQRNRCLALRGHRYRLGHALLPSRRTATLFSPEGHRRRRSPHHPAFGGASRDDTSCHRRRPTLVL